MPYLLKNVSIQYPYTALYTFCSHVYSLCTSISVNCVNYIFAGVTLGLVKVPKTVFSSTKGPT